MSQNLKPLADRIAAKFKPDALGWGVDRWERLRDHCDFASQCDLDCIQLDILTDMVEARIKERKS